LEARIRKQLQAASSSSVEEVPLGMLHKQEEPDRWLLENREERTTPIPSSLRTRQFPHLKPFS